MRIKKKQEVIKNDQFGLGSYYEGRSAERRLIRRIRRVALTIVLCVVTFAAQELEVYAKAKLALQASSSEVRP